MTPHSEAALFSLIIFLSVCTTFCLIIFLQLTFLYRITSICIGSDLSDNFYKIKIKLEMLSVENKPPAFNNLMSKETLHIYIFQVTLT